MMSVRQQLVLGQAQLLGELVAGLHPRFGLFGNFPIRVFCRI